MEEDIARWACPKRCSGRVGWKGQTTGTGGWGERMDFGREVFQEAVVMR